MAYNIQNDFIKPMEKVISDGKPPLAAADGSVMQPAAVADFIRRYNRWRRGDDTLEMPDPRLIGEALDRAADIASEVASCSPNVKDHR